MFYVYALKSKKHGKIYIGFSKNLKRRVKEHNLGKTKSTKYYGPWVLFYTEECSTRAIARKREKDLKAGSGREYLRSLLSAPIAHQDRAQVS